MENKNEPQFTLSPLGKEEGDLMVVKLKAFFEENCIDLVVTPMINKDGTIGAKAELFKKLELVPKGSVPFPNDILDGDGKKEAGA